MADSNRVRMSFHEETEWGVLPTAPDMQILPITSESLIENLGVSRSNVIRSDRQSPGLRRVSLDANGDLSFEMMYDNSGLGVFFKQVLQSAGWNGDSSTEESMTTTLGNVVTMTGAFTDMVAGQWFRMTGPNLHEDNVGYFQIATRTSNDSVVVGNGVVLENETAADTVIDSDGMIRNGVTFGSNTIQREYTDRSNSFIAFTGMSPGSMSLSVTPGDFITVGFSFMGKEGLPRAAELSSGAPFAASTNSSMTGVSDVSGIVEGNGLSTLDITNLTLNYDNALAGRPAIANLPPVSLRSGAVVLTGTLEAYFENRDLYEKFKRQTKSRISFRCEDAPAAGESAGNAYIFSVPSLNYTSGSAPAGGLDTDIIATMEFTAFLDDDLGTFQIDRFGAIS